MNKEKFNRLLRKIHFSKKAIKEIYEYYFPLIVIHLNRTFSCKVESRDIAHTVFLKLYKMEVTQYIIYPTSWLYKIAEYTALEVLRKDNKRKIAEEKSAIENVYENNFEIEIQDKDILNCLDNEKRHIIYLRYWERYSFKEIALMLNINYSTLKAKHKKAKLVLKTYLKKEIKK